MRQFSRRAAIRVLAAGSGLLGAGPAVGRALRDLPGSARRPVPAAGHLDEGAEVSCLSSSLPALFRNSRRYRRSLTYTAKGVAVVETSDDPRITAAIRSRAAEVTGFVDDGMPAMMAGTTGARA